MVPVHLDVAVVQLAMKRLLESGKYLTENESWDRFDEDSSACALDFFIAHSFS